MASNLLEAQYADLTDEELKTTIGYIHENLKKTQEALKADDEINDLKERAKELERDRYKTKIYGLVQQLKAARKLAKARRLDFRLDDLEYLGEKQ